MQRLTISAHFRGEATQPSGEPPQVDVTSNSEAVESMADDGSDPGIDNASYRTHATFTGESTFTEVGTIKIGDGEVDIVTVGEGTLTTSVDPELMHGSVFWRITEGRGQFDGASGLITSNFLLRTATGEVDERQIAVIFQP